MGNRISRFALVGVAALIGTALLPSLPARAVADDPVITGMFIMNTTPEIVTVAIFADANAGGTPCMLTFTPIGGTAMVVAGTVLVPGMNLVCAPTPLVSGDFGTTVDAFIRNYDPGYE